MKLWKLAVLLAPLVVAACSEVETIPTQALQADTSRIASPEQSSQRYYATGPQLPPPGVPVEYQAFTSIEVRADVGFIGQTAWGQSVVNYGGTNGTASVDLVARNAAGSVVASNNGSAADSHILPGNWGLTASTSMYVPAACGLSALASAKGSVWNAFLTSNQSLLMWGQKGGSDSKDALQPVCPPERPPEVCRVVASRSSPSADCIPDSPPGGGGETSPPYSYPYEPPSEPVPYYPPYYEPKKWTETCYRVYTGTDYERWECTSVENNDTRISGRGTPLSPSRGTHAGNTFSSAGPSDKLPSVFVIVSDAVPAGTMAVVDRRADGPYKNVILVPSAGLRPAELVRAMLYLYDSRSRVGESPSRSMSTRLKGTIADSDVSDAEREYAATFTTLLAKAKKSNVGQYGSRPVLEIRMGAPRAK